MIQLVKRIVQCLCLLIAVVSPVIAQERPSWAIIDATDRLIAQNALFLPSRDGFVRLPDGKLVHYELPSKNYIKVGGSWQVEILSRRWRQKEQVGWSQWLDARPQYSTWKIGLIQVDVLTSGVRARWVDNSKFAGGTPPAESEIMRHLDSQGNGVARSPAATAAPATDQPVPMVERSISSSGGTSTFTRQTGVTPRGLPAGMSRVPPSPARIAASGPAGTRNTAGSNFTVTPVPLSTLPPSRTGSPPAASPDLPAAPLASENSAATSPFSNIMPFIVVAVLVSSALPYAFKKTRRPSRRSKSDQANQQGSSRQSIPDRTPARSSLPAACTASAPNPLDLIQRTDNLLTPAELAFFAVLKPLIHASYHLSAKVRLADLFNAAQGRGQKTAFNKIVGKHIDFVVTDSATSRILCGIELDDSSHARPDRAERDRFVNEVFARNQLPLLRIPFSWTYYPAGLRAELEKAGLAVSGV